MQSSDVMIHRNQLASPISIYTYINKDIFIRDQLPLIQEMEKISAVLIKENSDTYFMFERNGLNEFYEVYDQPMHAVNGYITEVAGRALSEYITASLKNLNCKCSRKGMVNIKPSLFDNTPAVVTDYTLATTIANKRFLDVSVGNMSGTRLYRCSDDVSREFSTRVTKITYSPTNIIYHLTLSLRVDEIIVESSITDITDFKYFYDDFNQIPPYKSNPPLLNEEGYL